MGGNDSEVWRNVSKGTAVVYRFDHKGHLKDESVRGGSDVTLTSDERKINQQRARDASNDAFSNGMLQPIRLLDTVEDYESIASNPNHIGEDEMQKLFKLPVAKFRDRINEITNIVAMERIRELANDEETGAKLPLVNAANARYEELAPTWAGQEDDDDGFFGVKVKPVSPN